MAYKQNNPFSRENKELRKTKRKLIKEQRNKKRSGEITKQEFKDAKKEIKKYIDY